MKILNSCATVAGLSVLLAAAWIPVAGAGEFKDHCANGLANYTLLVETNCSVNWKNAANGKTYCFSSDKSKAEFLKDPAANLKKAEKAYEKLKDD